jgi:hypothetical protein
MVEQNKRSASFITDWRHPPNAPEVAKAYEEQFRSGHFVKAAEMFYLADSVCKGAFCMTCVMVQGLEGGTPVPHADGKPHSHNFDEVLLFTGTNPDDPHDLEAEIELWIEDEKHIITQGCMVYIPSRTKHLPLIFRKIGRPFYFITAGNVNKYEAITMEK